MTIIVRHNEALDLNLVEYRDAVILAELRALTAFGAANPEHMRRDALNIVSPGASFDTIELSALDAIFALYGDLYAALEFQIVRRAAWICHSPAAERHVRHWLGGDARENMSTAVRQFETFADAGEWLVLNDDEIAKVERAEGFIEVKNFSAAPAR